MVTMSLASVMKAAGTQLLGRREPWQGRDLRTACRAIAAFVSTSTADLAAKVVPSCTILLRISRNSRNILRLDSMLSLKNCASEQNDAHSTHFPRNLGIGLRLVTGSMHTIVTKNGQKGCS